MARQSDLSKLITELINFTDDFWQVGAVSTAIGTILTIASLLWVADFTTFDPNLPSYVAEVLGKFTFAFYILPIGIGFITFLFGSKTYNVYMKNRRYY